MRLPPSRPLAVILVALPALLASAQTHAAPMEVATALRALDPELARASSIEPHVRRFGARTVIRTETFVDELRVLGGDRVAVEEAGVTRLVRAPSLEKLGSFALPAAHAVARACETTRGCAFADPTVQDVANFARPVWFSTPKGLAPAFAVRVPAWSLHAVRDVVVSAEDGAILSSQPTVKLGVPVDAPRAAHAFVGFVPSGPNADLEAELEVVELEDLLPAPVGAPLRGLHFETNNCCKQYTCNDGSQTCIDGAVCTVDTAADDCAAYQTCQAGKCVVAEGTPLETIATCAEDGDPDAVDGFVNLAIPSDIIPFPIPGLGDTLYARVAFCTELPRVRSEAGAGPDGQDGWFPAPVDQDRTEDALLGLASEEDAFAEVSVYWGTQQFFKHIRAVLEDPAFCLEQESMSCDDTGAPLLDDLGRPELPFHISTNVLIPEINLNLIGQQILGGAGRDPGNPVVIDDYQRVPNAAFIPALDDGPVQVPPELAPLLTLFSRPFDSNAYFQGFRDFAYDGDVVRHEFTHAIVHTLNPQLLSLSRDAWGANAEPGALNEGWSDYFSSSFIGDSQVGEYASAGLVAGETGLRDNDNTKACPTDINGAVHDDSEPWAGALWAIRAQVPAADVNALDRALLSALALGDPDEGFSKASARAVEAIRAELGDELGTIAQEEFDSRALTECARMWPLAVLEGDDLVVTRKDTLAQPGAGDVGLTNFAPGVMQFRVVVPPGSAGFTLTWSQGGGAIQSAVGGGGDAEPLLVLVEETAGAVSWTYEGATGGLAVPHNTVGDEIDFDPTAAENAATIGTPNQTTGVAAGSFTKTLETDACASRSFVVQFLAPAGGTTMNDIDVTNIDADVPCDDGGGDGGGGGGGASSPCGCQGVGDAMPFAGLMLGLIALRRRRR